MWPWIWCHPLPTGFPRSLGSGDPFFRRVVQRLKRRVRFYGAWCHSANTFRSNPQQNIIIIISLHAEHRISGKKTMYNRININIDDPYVVVLTGNNSTTVASLRVFSYGKQWREVAHNCLDAAQLFHDCVQTPSSNSRFWRRTHKFKVF